MIFGLRRVQCHLNPPKNSYRHALVIIMKFFLNARCAQAQIYNWVKACHYYCFNVNSKVMRTWVNSDDFFLINRKL